MTLERNASPEQIEHEIAATRANIAMEIEEIQRRISPWRLLSEVMDGARGAVAGAARGARHVGDEALETGSEFAANLGRTIRQNPVPVVLLGVGLTWLCLSGRRNGVEARDVGADRFPATGSPHRAGAGETSFAETAAPSRGSIVAGEGEWPEQGAYAAPPGSRPHESTVGAQATPGRNPEQETGTIKETLAEIASDVRRQVPEIGDRVSRASEQMTETAGRYVSGAREAAREGIQQAGEAVRSYGAKARDVASEAGGAAVRVVARHPLLTAAALFAIGAGLAALIPRTRKEDAWMGESAEAVRDSARSLVTEVGAQAGDAARSVADAARSSAEEQGLTPGHAAQAARHVVDSATEVVHDTAEAAREQVDRRLHGSSNGSGDSAARGDGEAGASRPPEVKQ